MADKKDAIKARWQPIETAPEGELILVYVPKIHRGQDSCEVVIIYNGDQYWTNGGPNAGDSIEWEDDWHAGKPTHWQPLPSPPKAKFSILNNGETNGKS